MENDQTGKFLECVMDVVAARKKAMHFGPVIPSDLTERLAALEAAEKKLNNLKATLDASVVRRVRDFLAMNQKVDVNFNAAKAIDLYLQMP